MDNDLSSSERSKQIIQLIEGNPLSSALWEELAAKVRGQNDFFSIKSLNIIIEGLKSLERARANPDPKRELPKVSSLFQSLLLRLARSYNNPNLLKQVGLIYLRDLNLPGVAQQHFECSIRLGAPEKELRPLSDAAAMQNQSASVGETAGHTGVTTAEHAKPIASSLIRKTGSMLMLPHAIEAPVAEETVEEIPALPEDSLPASGPVCIDEAEAATRNGFFHRAELLLRKAENLSEDHPSLWQAWTNLGLACYDARKSAIVEKAFLAALKHNPKEVASHFNVALGHHLNGKQTLALASYKMANQIDPNHPKIWCNLGVLHFQMGNYTLAEAALRFAVGMRPDYARAWDNLAAALGAQNRLIDALDACKKVVKINPAYPEAHFKMGIIYVGQNDVAQAISAFRSAAILPGLTAYCEAFLAMLYTKLGGMEAAEAAAHRAASADPKCDLLWMAWNDIGKAWNAAGNYAQAVTALEEASKLKPDEPEAWILLSVTYQQLGDVEAASNAYQQAMDLNIIRPERVFQTT